MTVLGKANTNLTDRQKLVEIQQLEQRVIVRKSLASKDMSMNAVDIIESRYQTTTGGDIAK
jgi:hypothetical protein